MLFEEVSALALAEGAELLALPANIELPRWKALTAGNPREPWAGMAAEAEPILPGAASLLLLVLPYLPYREDPSQACISSFYEATCRVERLGEAIAERLCGAGFEAKARAKIPYKAYFCASLRGSFGKNGLAGMETFGSRLTMNAIVTNALFPLQRMRFHEAEGFDERCGSCRLCQSACPAGALKDDGLVDMAKCLRAWAQYRVAPMPEELRPLIGNSIWGCEECQRRCPRNHPYQTQPMPQALTQALDLRALLLGHGDRLLPWLGPRYAIPSRLQGRACLVAANLGRRELLPEIRALAMGEENEYFTREYARWARRRLNGEI